MGKLSTQARKRIGVVLGSLALVGVGGIATTAYFTSEVSIEAEVASGTLNINVDGNEGTAVPYSLPLETNILNPGVVSTAPFVINNVGTLDADVDIVQSASATDTLAGQIKARLLDGETELASGTLADIAYDGLIVPAGTAAALVLELTAPWEMTNDWQGQMAEVVLNVTAIQAGAPTDV